MTEETTALLDLVRASGGSSWVSGWFDRVMLVLYNVSMLSRPLVDCHVGVIRTVAGWLVGKRVSNNSSHINKAK